MVQRNAVLMVACEPAGRSGASSGGRAPAAGGPDATMRTSKRGPITYCSTMVARFQLGSRTAGESAVPHAAGGRNRFAQQLFTPLPGRYDLLAEVLSFGQNARWRRAMVDQHRAASRQPGSSTSPPEPPAWPSSWRPGPGARWSAPTSPSPCCRQGRRRTGPRRLATDVPLAAGRAEQLPFPDASFDALTFTYLLRYVDDPPATLRELGRVVKPGGTMASLDFLAPPRRFWRAWWWLYTRLRAARRRPGRRRAGLVSGRAGSSGPNISEHYRRFPVAVDRGRLADGPASTTSGSGS